MTDLSKVEYRVRKVERFIVTRYEEGANAAGTWKASTTHGEFDGEIMAFEAGCALAGAEAHRHGWPEGDGRMLYPQLSGTAAA